MAAIGVKPQVTIFFPIDKIQKKTTINLNWSCLAHEEENQWKRPYTEPSPTVEHIIAALKRGPFAALAAVGPRCYSDKPAKVKGVILGHPDQTVFGWKMGAQRISQIAIPIIICGVQRKEGRERVFFVLAQDVSRDPKKAIGKFRLHLEDQNVYVSSMLPLGKYDFDMFPPVSAEEKAKYANQKAVRIIYPKKSNLTQAISSSKNVLSFYRKIPEKITINRNWSCRPSEPENAWKQPYLTQPATVKSIKAALKRGPFAALAAVGPSCYSAQPLKLEKIIPDHPDLPVFGWKAGAERINHTYVPIIICGVRRQNAQEHLFFVRAQDVSNDPNQAIGTFQPHSEDQQVYVTSMATYSSNEFDMFPPVSKEEKEKYSDQEVVPTVFAGQPDLMQLMKEGKITISYVSP